MQPAAHRSPLRLEHLPHAGFALLVAAATVSLLTGTGPLCPWLLTLTVGLAVLYTAGLARWEGWQRRRAPWLIALVSVWLALVLLAPPSLQAAYAWCAVPLTCVALRAVPARAAGPVVAVFTAVLALSLAGGGGAASGDAVVAPVVALWTTAALYRRQQTDALRNRRLVGELHRTRDELARQQRAAGSLAERARIARELHDSLAQELAGSRMLLQAADRDWHRSPEAARARVRAAVETLGSNLDEARRLIADLTPPALEHGDLSTALTELCAAAQLAGAAPRVRFHAVGDPGPLPSEQATTLLRVAQGALANAREHADAQCITVTVRRDGARLVLQVADDGAGFATGTAVGAPDRTSGRGFGLPAMRDRLHEHGGTVTVASAPGHGTIVTADLPLRRTGSPDELRPPALAVAV